MGFASGGVGDWWAAEGEGVRRSMMRTVLRAIAAAGMVIALASCATAPTVDPPVRSVSSVEAEPVVIWWSRYAHELENVTHIVNDVWIGTSEEHPDENPRKHRDEWIERGVLPLDWAGGDVYADQGHDELVRKWSSAITNGHVGIAIDEFGTVDDELRDIGLSALRTFREKHPDAYIAVWHAGLVDQEVAEVYRDVADLVMLETYIEGGWLLGLRLGFRMQNARRFGIESISVPTVAVASTQFAQTPEVIRAQIEWFHQNASDFRGLAVYAPNRDRELVEYADSVIGELITGR